MFLKFSSLIEEGDNIKNATKFTNESAGILAVRINQFKSIPLYRYE